MTPFSSVCLFKSVKIPCGHSVLYRGADKSLAQPTSRCILLDGENISFDVSLVVYVYSKNCLKRNAIVPVFFPRFHRFPFYKGLCFNKTKYKKYDRLGLQLRNNLK